MATITPVPVTANPRHDLYTWSGLSTGSTVGAAVNAVGNGDRNVQVIGTFGGGTVSILGSLDNVNFEVLQDVEGAALTFTAAGIKGVLESPPWIRPAFSSTGGSVDVMLSVNR
jgi:hypothetical protein